MHAPPPAAGLLVDYLCEYQVFVLPQAVYFGNRAACALQLVSLESVLCASLPRNVIGTLLLYCFKVLMMLVYVLNHHCVGFVLVTTFAPACLTIQYALSGFVFSIMPTHPLISSSDIITQTAVCGSRLFVSGKHLGCD